jgi:hypothetical protein
MLTSCVLQESSADEVLYCASQTGAGPVFETFTGQKPLKSLEMTIAWLSYDVPIQNKTDFLEYEAVMKYANKDNVSYIAGDVSLDYQGDLTYATIPIKPSYSAAATEFLDFKYLTGTFEQIKDFNASIGGYCNTDKESVYQKHLEMVDAYLKASFKAPGDSFEYAGLTFTVSTEITYQDNYEDPEQVYENYYENVGPVAIIPIRINNYSEEDVVDKIFLYKSYVLQDDWIDTLESEELYNAISINNFPVGVETTIYYFIVPYLGDGEYRIDFILMDYRHHTEILVELNWE